MAAPVKPDVISTFGFAQAPVTKFLLMTTGVSSVTVALLPSQYKLLFGLSLDWIQVVQERQIWRLLTSQFVIDESLTDLLSNCFLVYHFLILERRWGSAKYVSFLLTTWSISLGLYFGAYKFQIMKGYSPHHIVPSGLYGPLFALFVYYSLDIHQGHSTTRVASALSNKFFVYIIMLQTLISIDSPEKTMMCLCGTIAGIMYRTNFLKLQSWFRVPDRLSSACRSLFSYFGFTNAQHEVSRKVFMGATPEIQEDIMYDYMTKKQQSYQRIPDGGRVNMGQGYADVMNPSVATLMRNFGGGGGGAPRQRAPAPPIVRQPTPPLPEHLPLETDSVSEEKVQTLVDMGFARDAVVNALASVDNDLQQATTILLSAASS